MDFLHAVFAVDRHEVSWLDEAEHEFLLLLASVSRGVDVVNLAVDDFYASFNQDIDNLVDSSCISRDGAGGEDHCITRL